MIGREKTITDKYEYNIFYSNTSFSIMLFHVLLEGKKTFVSITWTGPVRS